MPEQQSNTGIILGIILFVIIVIGFIVLIFLGIKFGWFNSEPKQEILPNSKFLIHIIDANSGEKIDSDFTVRSYSGFEKKGNYEAGILSEVELPNGTYFLHGCNEDEDYYSQLIVTPIIPNQKVQIDIDCMKIEKSPEITHTGIIEEGNGEVTLNITVKNYLRNIFMCLDYDIGFVMAEFERKIQDCEVNWTNCSRTEKDKCVEYYPNSFWMCTNPKTLIQCSEVDGKECYLPKMEIPSFLEGKVKSCSIMDQSIIKTDSLYKINYRTWNLYPEDCIRVYIGDSDFDLSNNVYIGGRDVLRKILFFLDDKDIKAPTFEYEICK